MSAASASRREAVQELLAESYDVGDTVSFHDGSTTTFYGSGETAQALVLPAQGSCGWFLDAGDRTSLDAAIASLTILD